MFRSMLFAFGTVGLAALFLVAAEPEKTPPAADQDTKPAAKPDGQAKPDTATPPAPAFNITGNWEIPKNDQAGHPPKGFRFPDDKPFEGHPRVFFNGPPEKHKLLENMSPERAAIWKKVLAGVPASPPPEDTGRRFGHDLGPLALVYGISGDKKYRDIVLAAVKKGIATDALWGGEKLNKDEMLWGVALAYDCCYHDLSEDERKAIRKKMLEMMPKMGRGNWAVRPICNQTWCSTGALACAAFAILGEEPEAADYLKYCDKLLADKNRFRSPDGSVCEGIQYGAYEGIWGLVHRHVLERALYPNSRTLADEDVHGWTARYVDFWLHAAAPGHNGFADFGDSRSRGKTPHAVGQAFAYFAGLYQHQGRELDAGLAEWMRQHHGEGGAFAPLHFLWYREGVKPIAPEGKVPVYGHFRDYEYHFFRDSWQDPKSTWFAFKCTPQPSRTFWNQVKLTPTDQATGKGWESSGHCHQDTGHFSLVSEGQWLFIDDGYGGSTISNHNTLNIDGCPHLLDKGSKGVPGGDFGYRPEKDKTHAGIDVYGEVDSPAGSFLTGDMTAAYKGAKTVHRHVLILPKPMRIVIADRVEAEGGKEVKPDPRKKPGTPVKAGPRMVDWCLHTEPKAIITRESAGILVKQGAGSVRVQVARPKVDIETVPDPRGNKPTAIYLSAPLDASPFIVALLPGPAAKAASATADGFTFPGGETVKWNFTRPAEPLCILEGPTGIVAAQASKLDLPWLKLESDRPVNISIDKNGKGSLAVPPGGNKAEIKVTVNGNEKKYSVMPDAYQGLE